MPAEADDYYLTKSDLEAIGVTKYLRDSIIRENIRVRAENIGPNHSNAYALRDLLKSAIFRFSLVLNYQDLPTLELSGKKVTKSWVKKILQDYRFGDRYWFEKIHQYHQYSLVAYVIVLMRMYQRRYQELLNKTRAMQKQSHDLQQFRFLHSELFDVNDNIDEQVFVLNPKFDTNKLTHLFFKDYNEKICWAIDHLEQMDYVDHADEVKDLVKKVDPHFDFSFFKLEHLDEKDYLIFKWIVRIIEKDKDRFDQNYRDLVDGDFDIKYLAFGDDVRKMVNDAFDGFAPDDSEQYLEHQYEEVLNSLKEPFIGDEPGLDIPMEGFNEETSQAADLMSEDAADYDKSIIDGAIDDAAASDTTANLLPADSDAKAVSADDSDEVELDDAGIEALDLSTNHDSDDNQPLDVAGSLASSVDDNTEDIDLNDGLSDDSDSDDDNSDDLPFDGPALGDSDDLPL